ncbi:hypothetical protein SHIRM173S_05008 [Streptomyces hirsutus]
MCGDALTDPRDGRLIGVVDVSGPLETMHPSTLAWVDAVAKLAEARLGSAIWSRWSGCGRWRRRCWPGSTDGPWWWTGTGGRPR